VPRPGRLPPGCCLSLTYLTPYTLYPSRAALTLPHRPAGLRRARQGHAQWRGQALCGAGARAARRPSRPCPALAARMSPGAACGRCVPAVRSSQGPPCSSGTRHTRRKPGRLSVGATVTGLGEDKVTYPHARAGPDRGGAGGRAARGGGAPGLVRAAPRPCLWLAPRAGAACGLRVPRWTGPVRAGGRALPSGHACC